MSTTVAGQKHRRVSAMFGRIARRYDFMNSVMTLGMDKRWRRLGARLACEGMADALCLDAGTGTGMFAFELGRNPGVASVVGLDLVRQMLDLAVAGHGRPGTKANLHWAQGDCMALPFRDGSFDCAVTAFTVRNVEDIGRAIGEMRRVVRPGGRVVILEISPLDKPGFRSRAVRWYFRRTVPLLGGLLAGDRAAYAYLPESVESFPAPAVLSRLMEQAGLRGVYWRSLGMGLVSLHVGEVAGAEERRSA